MTLDEKVRKIVSHPIVKHHLHGYPEDDLNTIVDERINSMTMVELLEVISQALHLNYALKPD